MQGIWTEFTHTLRRLRGQILGWGIGLALYGVLMGLLFDAMQTMVGIEEMLASYPPELMAFFGDVMTMNTPAGYFGVYYASYLPLIVGIFICAAAAGVLALMGSAVALAALAWWLFLRRDIRVGGERSWSFSR